ncbi:MAG: hypothetical protein QHH75_04810 [Bacillota bacterium]|nr:hypothetical protein [Bacillota bacterium]
MNNDEKILKMLESIQNQLHEHTKILNQHSHLLDEHTRRFDKIEIRQSEANSRLDEHTQILRALEHASSVHKADIDNLTHAVARIEGDVKEIRNYQNRQGKILDRLAVRSIEQEADIHALRSIVK